MLLLAADIGNTNMQFGLYNNEKLEASFRLITNRNITSDELGLMIRQFMLIHEVKTTDLKDVIISSVVPQIMYSVKNAMRKYLQKEPLVIEESIKVPIENRYRNPKEVGADRLVNAYGAYKKYGGNLIVVDFGTATNFDVINGDGAYLGGALYPGLTISLDALVDKTAKLPRVEIVKPECAIGKNTVMSMQSGILYGYTGAVKNIISEIEKDLGAKPKVIATGGLAKLVAGQSDLFSVIDKSLTLDSINLIYRLQKRVTA